MPFVNVPGLAGKVYVPEKQESCEKKHSCKDCFSCEHCSDDRCNVCLGNNADSVPPLNGNRCRQKISACLCPPEDTRKFDEH